MSDVPDPAQTPEPAAPGRLTTGEVRRHLVGLTMPMIWGLLAVIAFNVVDTFFVAQLGTRELAAISFTFPVIMTLGSLSIGLSIGATSVLSRAIGRGDRGEVKRLATDSLSLSLLVVGALVAVGLLTIDPLFTALGAGPELLPLIRGYMEIWYFGSLALVVPMVGNGLIRATGDAKFPSYIMIAAAIINAILDPILIFGWFGVPRLEMEGAAIATVLSRAITLVATLLVLHFRERLLLWTWPTVRRLAGSWRAILHVGLPAALTQIVNPVSVGIVTAIVARYGDEAVAGFGVATRIEALATVPLLALSAGVSPFVGQNDGAGRMDRVMTALRLGFRFSLLWGVLLAVVLGPAGPYIAALFDDHPQVQAVTSLYLWIVPVTLGFYGVLIVSNAGFNALGRPLPATLMAAIRMIGIYVPLAWIASMMADLWAVFAAAALANLATGLVAWWWNHTYCLWRAADAAAPTGEAG